MSKGEDMAKTKGEIQYREAIDLFRTKGFERIDVSFHPPVDAPVDPPLDASGGPAVGEDGGP